METNSPPRLPATLRQWVNLKSIQWRKALLRCLGYVSVFQDLAVYDDEKLRSQPVTSMLDDLWKWAEDIVQSARQHNIPEPAYFAHGAQNKIDWHHQHYPHRIPLIIGTGVLVLAVTIPQIAIAFCLEEWNTVARATADHGRTVVMFIALATFPSINPPLIWLFAQNRLIGSLPSIIFYSIPAFYKPLRYLYGTDSYTYAVIPVLLIWLAIISFYDPLRIAFTRALTRKQSQITAEARAEAQTLKERGQQLTLRFELAIEPIATSDPMGQHVSLLKKDIEYACLSLEHSMQEQRYATPVPPAQTHYPRGEKFPILIAALACMLSDILTNLDKPFFMTEKVAINAWITARLFLCAWSNHQSKADMQKLCCDLLSGPTLSLVLVTPAKLANLFKTDKYLLVLTISHTAIIFIFARHTAILHRAIGKLVTIAVQSLATAIRFSVKLASRPQQQQNGTVLHDATVLIEELGTKNGSISTATSVMVLNAHN